MAIRAAAAGASLEGGGDPGGGDDEFPPPPATEATIGLPGRYSSGRFAAAPRILALALHADNVVGRHTASSEL